MECSEEEIIDLVARLRSGDPLAVNLLILCFTDLAHQIAYRFLKRTKRNKDELVAEAQFLLTKTVNRAKEVLIDNGIKEYIAYSVHRGLLYYLHKTQQISTLSKHNPVKVVAIDKLWDDETVLMDRKGIFEQETRLLMEVLESCIKTPAEQSMFKLRLKGDTSEEISQRLNVSLFTVRKTLRDLRKRFQRAL